jgi:hypothetical protein
MKIQPPSWHPIWFSVLFLLSLAGPVVGGSIAPPPLRDFDLVELDPTQFEASAALGVPVTIAASDRVWELQVILYDLRAENYRAVAQTDLGSLELPLEPVRSYKGTVIGNPDSVVRLALTDEGVEGYIRTSDDWVFIEPASRYRRYAAPSEHVLYRTEDVAPLDPPPLCAAPDASGSTALGKTLSSFAGPRAASFRQLEIATEADYEMYLAFGSSAAAVNNHILQILVLVEGIYEHDLGITYQVVFQHVWATSNDPYTTNEACGGGTNLLDQFMDYWNANYAGINRDTAHLWTGKDICVSSIPPPNQCSVIGCAYGGAGSGALCNSFAYGESENFSANLNNLVLLTAHEIGHNHGSGHDTDPCPNAIMRASLQSCATNFSPTAIGWIGGYTNGLSCLTSVTPRRLLVGPAAGNTVRRYEPAGSP